MPSKTISMSDANFARIIAALEDIRDEENPETDAELYMRWLKSVHTERAFKHERRTAQGEVAADSGIAEIT